WGRVLGAWRFATRPTEFRVRARAADIGLSLSTQAAVALGGDRVHARFDGQLTVDPRVPVGDLVFDLPGTDEIRRVVSDGLDTWWTEGEGETRTLHLRYAVLRTGSLRIQVITELRLGGKESGITVPRWSLRGARRDQGVLVLYALSDVDLAPGAIPNLRATPLVEMQVPAPPAAGAEARYAYRWESPLEASLRVALHTPSPEVEAVVVSAIRPGDEAHRLEHLVLYDVRRGRTDRFELFVPDGGLSRDDVLRTRDLREIREERVRRRDGADGAEVDGTLYTIRLQSPKGGLVEVTLSQWTDPSFPVRVVVPEGVSDLYDLNAVRYFGLVRAFLDGQVDVRATAGDPDPALWGDLPFLPADLARQDVVRAYAARTPYILSVVASRHRLEAQAPAVVRALLADAVLGRDGQLRVRANYRIFNRSRQFFRLRLPEGGVLFGVTAAGRPVKPLRGLGGDLLVPIPKVPLGDAGYAVSVLYRAPAGDVLPEGDLQVVLPQVADVEVDRTVLRLYVPDGFDYDIETDMTEAEEAEVAADLAEAAVREARDLLEVAGSGTLDQRNRAAMNGGLLLSEARRLLREPAVKNLRPELELQVAQVEDEWQSKQQAVQADLEAAQREALGRQFDLFSSNAAQLVDLDEITNGLDMPGLAGDRPAPDPQTQEDAAPGQTRAGWRFNREDAEEGEQQEVYRGLKTRFEEALREREATVQGQGPAPVQTAGDDGQMPDEEFFLNNPTNFRGINAALGKLQQEQFQLGAVVQDLDVEVGPDHVVNLPGQMGPQTAAGDAANRHRLSRALAGYLEATKQAFERGDYAVAREYANVLLQQDPSNENTRVLLSLADQAQGGRGQGAGGREFDAQWRSVLFDLESVALPQTDPGGFSLPRATLRRGGDGQDPDAFFSGSDADPYDTSFGFFAQPPVNGTPNDTGIFFNDGGDGTYAGRVENLFGESLGTAGVDLELIPSNFEPPDISFDDGRRIRTWAESQAGGRAKSGLMGVDVPLPRRGRVYHFRSLGTGMPLTVSASREETGPFAKWLVFLLVIGAVTAGVVLGRRAWHRHQSATAA
ncbi:MAG: hypothetical protein ACYTG6_05665, partial [Planctomycetota bacterium]